MLLKDRLVNLIECADFVVEGQEGHLKDRVTKINELIFLREASMLELLRSCW